jgi:hypothetical protein
MKALSVRQPWAGLIVAGLKDIENRTWTTRYRGPLLIHASQRADSVMLCDVARDYGVTLPRQTAASFLRTGGIVGMVDLIDVVEQHHSNWFHGPYGFVLANARALPFKPMSGKLMLFDVAEFA